MAQQGTLVLPTSQKLAGTSPHNSPHGEAGGSTAPGALARGEQTGGSRLSTGSSLSGMGWIWPLPSSAQMSSELPREFLETKTGCFQAASRQHGVTSLN